MNTDAQTEARSRRAAPSARTPVPEDCMSFAMAEKNGREFGIELCVVEQVEKTQK
jgi:hypothetical protein